MSNRKFNEMVTKVKVTNGSGWYSDRVSEVFNVTGNETFGSILVFNVEHPDNTEHERYVIQEDDCEPVEIRYNGERYRLESRKAEVGEKVVVVNPYSEYCPYGVGDTFTVKNHDSHDIVSLDGTTTRLFNNEYRVLVPVTESSVSTTQATADHSDKILDMLTALSQEVAELKREVQALKGREITVGAPKITINTPVTVEEVKERVKKALEPLLGRKLTSPFALTASCDTDGISIKTEVSKPLTRADVVKCAQADVEALKADMTNVANPYLRDRKDIYLVGSIAHTAEFIVNREKRTVVCLLHYAVFSESVNHRGIAKCAPDDVFNVDIGKAIALRRALGLSVPDEYTNAPAPDGVAYYDIVLYDGEKYVVTPTTEYVLNNGMEEAQIDSPVVISGKLIDDSDREEYRKGACC
jgi:hypothetical protein